MYLMQRLRQRAATILLPHVLDRKRLATALFCIALLPFFWGGGSRGSCQYSVSLRTVRSGDQILVGAIFSTLLQTGPGAHTASYTMSTGSFSGVKRPGRGVDHPHPSSADVKERV